MRTAHALLVTFLAPVGLVTTETAADRAPLADTAVQTDGEASELVIHRTASVSDVQVSLAPEVRIVRADNEDRALLDEALGRFRDHRLELPDLEIRFSDDEADCGGHLGRFEQEFTPWRLSICTDLASAPTHELAHAWEAANLDDDDRARYIEARGLTNWNDPAAGWVERGVEDAARMLQQNLSATNPVLTLPAWTERLDAYELLVGRPSPLRNELDDVGKQARVTTADTTIPKTVDSPPGVPETSFVELEETAVVGHLPEPVCAQGTTATELEAFFDLGDPMIGADYQRAFALPDGRVLWLFQDAFLATAHGPELVHNVGLLQSGQCFQLLRNGSTNAPKPYLLPELTERHDRWFWPLGGGVGLDGNLHVFVAEMQEHGTRYLSHTEPVATWLVSIDLETFDVVDARPAPNPSAELYGWSVVSQSEFTYLYAHCYRQFGWDLFPFADPPFRGHDWTCGPDVTVARIPRSDFGATPEYWNGTTWASDPAGAVPVIPREGRSVNPAQVGLLDGQFVAVTKVGDWWGDTIYLDVAPAAEGPWRTYETVTVAPECESCNTYFASILPYGADENSFVLGVSINTWSGDDLDHYTPTFLRVPAPNTSVATTVVGSTPG